MTDRKKAPLPDSAGSNWPPTTRDLAEFIEAIARGMARRHDREAREGAATTKRATKDEAA